MDSTPPIQSKNLSHPVSEILSAFFGRHQELLLDELRWGRALGMKCQLEEADDPIDNFEFFSLSLLDKKNYGVYEIIMKLLKSFLLKLLAGYCNLLEYIKLS